MTIIGPGASVIEVNGNHRSQVFSVNGSASPLTISGLTIANGYPTDGQGGGIRVSRPAVANLTDVVVEDNTATAAGGNYSEGGGIFSQGTLTLTRYTVRNNAVNGGVLAAVAGAFTASGARSR